MHLKCMNWPGILTSFGTFNNLSTLMYDEVMDSQILLAYQANYKGKCNIQ